MTLNNATASGIQLYGVEIRTLLLTALHLQLDKTAPLPQSVDSTKLSALVHCMFLQGLPELDYHN